MKTHEKLTKYLEQLSKFTLPTWDKIPDLDLYMDQTITYIERELMPLLLDRDKEKFITASMINNYVKNGIIKPPVSKKYNKQHLSEIFLICCLKQILTISDIGKLFSSYNADDENVSHAYEYLRMIQKDKLQSIVGEMLEELKLNNQDELVLLSFKLAIEASIKKTIADYIMFLINQPRAKNNDKETAKTVKEKNTKQNIKEKNDKGKKEIRED